MDEYRKYHPGAEGDNVIQFPKADSVQKPEFDPAPTLSNDEYKALSEHEKSLYFLPGRSINTGREALARLVAQNNPSLKLQIKDLERKITLAVKTEQKYFSKAA